jgi:hypothetical protein
MQTGQRPDDRQTRAQHHLADPGEGVVVGASFSSDESTHPTDSSTSLLEEDGIIIIIHHPLLLPLRPPTKARSR